MIQSGFAKRAFISLTIGAVDLVLMAIGFSLCGASPQAWAASEDAATGTTQASSTSETATTATAATAQNTSAAKPATYYSVAQGKGSWVREGKRKVGYRYQDGAYPTRVTKIGSKVYLFKSKGRLSTSKKTLRVVKVNGSTHGVGKSGQLVKGWHIKGSSLYYFRGRYLKGKASGTRGDIRFAANGRAVEDLNAALKVTTTKVLKKITKPSMSKQAKLRAIWNYTVSKKRWRYATPYTSFSFLKSDSWAKRYAYQMLITHRGNCYGFACAFAALAYEAGYTNVRIAVCRVPGSPDHAADGYTHHGLVQLNGCWYDPEAQFEGWLKGVYGYRTYPFNMKALDTRQFSTYVGTGKPRGISASFNQSVKLSIVKKGAYYWGRDNRRPIVGLYSDNHHLYRFDAKGRMKVSAYKKMQKAIKYKKPWSSLRKLIGKPDKVKTLDSCAGAGKDVAYLYDRVVVTTFRPASGKGEYITGVSSR